VCFLVSLLLVSAVLHLDGALALFFLLLTLPCLLRHHSVTMLSMFKDKKGFSVLFRDVEKDTAVPAPVSVEASGRRSSRASGTVSRYTGGSGVAQLQCQRCSKRFSALEEDESEGQACCRRCGYPTCPQCREAVAGTPPWVCCVCDGPKSLTWLLERTKMGPRLVSKIIEFCDPRGQRLMRWMFRFTLQQYRAASSPRPSLAIGATGGRAGSGVSSAASRATGTSQTPPAAPSGASKSRTGTRASGERGAGSAGLSAVSASHSNVHRPSPYSHPKHASLLRSAGRLSATEGKENSQAADDSAKRPHGSEVLRRDDAVAVVEYSPEPQRQVVTAAGDDNHPNPNGGDAADKALPLSAEDQCAAVQDIYRASDTTVTPRSTLASGLKAEDAVGAASSTPHVRPSGHAAFQREAPRQLPPNNNNNSNNNNADPVTPVDRETEAVKLNLGATSMSITSPGQACRLGCSFSRTSSGSGRSESPAPRFPSFAQFLDDQAAVVAGQTNLPRESDVLVTVSPDSSEDDEKKSNVVELGNVRGSRLTTNVDNNGGLRTPRGTQPCTPPSAVDSSSRRHERRTSGLSGDFTPTRALDLSDARGTVRRGSSSRRRTTRGSLLEMHAPHLYGSGGGGGGAGRRSGQVGDSPFMYDLPSQFSSGGGGGNAGVSVHSARGQIRRQHAPLATRTAGRTLGGGACGSYDPRGRFAQQNSRTVTPLQRTASRNGGLHRVPSGASRAMARTNSATGQFASKSSANGRGAGFGRLNSGTAPLVRTPSSRTRLAGVQLSPNGRVLEQQQHRQQSPLQQTESAKLVRTASATGIPHPRAGAPAALERTHSHYGLATSASPLKRTASLTALGGAAPFGRLHSSSAFTRSATVTAGFTRTNSANVFGRGGAPGGSTSSKNDALHHPHGASSRTFARTATGTYLSGGRSDTSRGRFGAAAARTRIAGFSGGRSARPANPIYAWRRSEGSNGDRRLASARTKTPGRLPGAASPLQRTNTATRHNTAAAAAVGVRLPTPTGLSRTATNPRTFERQSSHPLGLPQHQTRTNSAAAGVSGGGARTRVDPAPALVGVTRRKTATSTSSGLRRTPSAMSRSDSFAGATPRTPRPYIVASVSTAGTPAVAAAAAAAVAVHNATRPVLSSGASSPKTRSTRDSLTSGSTGTTRTSGGGAASPVSTTPVVKTLSGVALAGGTSAPRHRRGVALTGPPHTPAAATGGSRSGAMSRAGAGTRSNTPSNSGAARTRTGSTHPPTGFGRLNSGIAW
jgi:hypothetical protein